MTIFFEGWASIGLVLVIATPAYVALGVLGEVPGDAGALDPLAQTWTR